MKSVVFVALDRPLIARCWTFGEQMINGYATGRMSEENRLPGNSVDLQAHGKMAECAFAHFAGLDPIKALDWFGERKNGDGYDMIVGSHRAEVRHTKNGHCLIWPAPRRKSFATKRFTMLALVIGQEPVFEIAGVVSKPRFFAEKIEADGYSFLDEGTWFMDRDELDDAFAILPKDRS